MNVMTDTTAAPAAATAGTNWYEVANHSTMALRYIETLASMGIEEVIEAHVEPDGSYRIDKRKYERCEALFQAIEDIAARAEKLA